MKELYKSSNDNTSLWVDKVCYWFLEQLKEVNLNSTDPTFSKENNAGTIIETMSSFFFQIIDIFEKLDYPLNTLPSAVRAYFDEIFDTQSKLKAIALCRKGILNTNAGK